MIPSRLGFATALARKAGLLAQEMRGQAQGLAVTSKAPMDFVTNADLAVEALIRERIAQAYPEDAVLGEENGLEGEGPACWIVDPIDGTTNYARGMGDWGISIAYFDGQNFTHGVIFLPDLNIMATAEAGKGAQLNGKPVRFDQRAGQSGRMLALGYSGRTTAETYSARIARLTAAQIEHRRHGAATVGLVGTLAGWFDGYHEASLNIWDGAAGLLMVQEAGGVTIHGEMKRFLTEPTEVIAHNGKIPNLYGILVPDEDAERKAG